MRLGRRRAPEADTRGSGNGKLNLKAGPVVWYWARMNDVSDYQRLADAIAALAMTLSEKLRTADEDQEPRTATQPPAPTKRRMPADGYPNRYAPIPPNGHRCEFTGLGHAKLYNVLSLGGPVRKKVRVANLRAPGARRGQTLYHVGDLLRYLDELAATQGTQQK